MSRLDEIINTVTANGMREITVERAKQIAVEYATECTEASLEEASEKLPYDNIDEKMLLESIITDKQNITLL